MHSVFKIFRKNSIQFFKQIHPSKKTEFKEKYTYKDPLSLSTFYTLKETPLKISNPKFSIEPTFGKDQTSSSKNTKMEYLVRRKKFLKTPTLPKIVEETIKDDISENATPFSKFALNEFKKEPFTKGSIVKNDAQAHSSSEILKEQETKKLPPVSLSSVKETDLMNPTDLPFSFVLETSASDVSVNSSEILVLESSFDDKRKNTPLPYKRGFAQKNQNDVSDNPIPEPFEKYFTQIKEKNDTLILNVPSDGNCLLHAIATPYLFGALHDEIAFQERFSMLFGEVEKTRCTKVHQHLLDYNPYRANENTLYSKESSWGSLINTFRDRIVDYISKNTDDYKDFICLNHTEDYNSENLNKYLEKMSTPGFFMGNVEIKAASELLNHPIKVTQGIYNSLYNENTQINPICLHHVDRWHYNFEWKRFFFNLTENDKDLSKSSPKSRVKKTTQNV